jgi:CRISPR/Cas system endoribonuclease Cas6 (RAMP superfamily)
MRIKATFKTDKLPILYRHSFMALIKEALEKSDNEHSNLIKSERYVMVAINVATWR